MLRSALMYCLILLSACGIPASCNQPADSDSSTSPTSTIPLPREGMLLESDRLPSRVSINSIWNLEMAGTGPYEIEAGYQRIALVYCYPRRNAGGMGIDEGPGKRITQLKLSTMANMLNISTEKLIPSWFEVFALIDGRGQTWAPIGFCAQRPNEVGHEMIEVHLRPRPGEESDHPLNTTDARSIRIVFEVDAESQITHARWGDVLVEFEDEQ